MYEMKKNRRKWMIFAAVVALLVLAGGLTQHYLKDNLVVAIQESHDRAHVEESTDGEDASETVASENLVANYSFEVGSDLEFYDWETDGEDPGTGIWRDQEVSAFGFSSAAMLARDTSRGTDLILAQKLQDVPAGQEVTVKGWVKTEELHGNAFLRVDGFISEEPASRYLVWLSLDEVTGTADWQEVQGTLYLPPEVTGASVSVGIFGEGKAWFDEISLTAVERVPAPLPRDENLLRNPDFAQSTLYWHYFSVPGTPKVDWGVRDSGGATGPNLFLTQPSPVDQSQYSGFYQVVNGLDHTTDLATLRGRVRAEDLEGEAWLALTFYGLNGRGLAESDLALSGSRDWEYLEVQVQVPDDAKSVWVRLIFNGTGTAAFDDIDFRLMPLQ
jgi:hypothetical protein